jgi:hypothetical protein
MEHDLITDSWDILCVAMILVTLCILTAIVVFR